LSDIQPAHMYVFKCKYFPVPISVLYAKLLNLILRSSLPMFLDLTLG